MRTLLFFSLGMLAAVLLLEQFIVFTREPFCTGIEGFDDDLATMYAEIPND